MTEVGRITAIIDGDISKLTSALSLARSQATNAVAGIETGMKGGLKNGLAGINWNGLGMDTASDYLRGITAGMGPIGTALEGVATALGPTGMVAVAAIAGGAIIAKAAYDAASAWEAGMAQISKTTGIEKGSSGFNDLSEDLKDLYATMPTTMSEIQNVAKSAGSLGIEESSIAGYTRVALEMGSAFDIPAEQAAVSIGKVQSQLKALPEGVEDSAQFARNFGSAVDYAGNSMNATEEEVLNFSTRTAGALSLLGGTAYEIAGWGGATASVFSSSQLAAGSFNAALTQLTGTTKGSVTAQEEAAKLLGITSEEFVHLMSTDPTDTILRLGNALESLDPSEATKTAGILGGGYGDDFFKKMVGHTDEWRGKIDEVVAAGEKGESIGKSFEAGSEGAKAAMQELKNSISTILIDIGGPILAAFTPLLSGLADGLNKIREIGENLWGPLTTVLSPLTTGAGILAGHIGTMAGMSLDVLVLASQAISKAFELGGKYAEAVKAEILEIIENSGPFKAVSGFVDDIRDAFQRLYDKVAEVVSKIADGLSNAIPTAIKGTGDALGTLAEKAGLGGVADAAGGVLDFFGDVNARVWGKETGDEMAEGIKTDSGLSKAPGEALDSEEAKKAAQIAADKLSDDFATRYSAQLKSGISKELAGTMAGFQVSEMEALDILNSQSSSPKKNDGSIDLSPWADRPTPYLSGYDRDYIGGSSQAFLKSVRVPDIGSVNSITEMKDALMEYGATAQQTGAIIEELFSEDSKYAKYMRVEWGGEWEAMKASNDQLREGAEDKAKYMQEYLDAPEVEWENNSMSKWISGLPLELQAVEDFDTGLQKSLYNISQGLDIGGTTKRDGGLVKRLAELTTIGGDDSEKISQNIKQALDAVYAGLSDEDMDFEEHNILTKYLDFLATQGADQASIDAIHERLDDQLANSGGTEIATEARLKELSSIDLATMKANITEIESEIAGLSQGLQNVDKAFEEMSIEPVDMVIALQTSQAREDWNLLVNDIEGLTVRMPVELDVRVHADEIRAMIAEELRAGVV